MSRLPYAAETLISQVEGAKSFTVEPADEPDGFDVHRTIKFDKSTSKKVAPLLDAIEDPRVEQVNLTDAGYLHVTFVEGPEADDRDKFPLDAAELYVKMQAEGSIPEGA